MQVYSNLIVIKDEDLAVLDNEKIRKVHESLKAIKNSDAQFRAECHNKGIRTEEFNLNYTV